MAIAPESMLSRIAGLAFAAVLVAATCGSATAEDIDIFAPRSAGPAADPNLLVILDNSVNGARPFGSTTRMVAAARALATAIDAMTDTSARINIGLMLFNENGRASLPGGAPTGPNDGAYVRYAMRTMTSAANRGTLVSLLNGLDSATDRGSGAHNTLALEEARRYFGGLPVRNGGNTAGKLDLAALDATLTTYLSPVATSGCQKNFVLFVGNGPPALYDTTAAAQFAMALGEGTLPVQLTLPPPQPMPVLPASQDAAPNWMDEFAGILRDAPYPAAEDGAANAAVAAIVSYTLSLHDPLLAIDNDSASASGRALLFNAAIRGGGRYRDAVDAQSLTRGIASVLAEVQAVNTMFGSPALPAGLNPLGTQLNQVYMGMFRVDENGSPRWTGNLKQYQFAYDSMLGTLELVDAQGEPVVSAATGFITPTARSFWSTPQTAGPLLPSGSASVDFFANAPDGSGLTGREPEQEAPDGEVVDKGGAAQQLRAAYLGNQASRNLVTCPLAGCATGASLLAASGYALDTNDIACPTHGAAFGFDAASCAGELPLLVAWLRGADNNPGSEAMAGPGGLGPSPIRPSVHGDVLHPKPLLINHGAPGIVAYYGANDGTLRAVRAGQPSSGGGRELWAFAAPESFGKFRRLREGAPLLQMPSRSSGLAAPSTAKPGTKPKDYFFDGPITHFEARDASGNLSRAWLFAAARRGGAFLYAFDVTAPSAPRFLWRHAAFDGTDPAFDDLAMTFSGAKAARVAGVGEPVVIFGGGYAGGYDATGAP
ncbi:MAG: hypothetical protein ABI831_25970, partial [Betaproteobacteria bacterium]